MKVGKQCLWQAHYGVPGWRDEGGREGKTRGRRGRRCLGRLDSWRSVYLFKRELLSGSKTKWGIMWDQKRTPLTTCCPAPLFPPLPSPLCQHEHPVHTQRSCRNYGPLCLEGAPKNARVDQFYKDSCSVCLKCNVSWRLSAVVPKLFNIKDCQNLDSHLVRWHPKEPNKKQIQADFDTAVKLWCKTKHFKGRNTHTVCLIVGNLQQE